MPFVPHNAGDVAQMLATIGVQSIDELFDEIPPQLMIRSLEQVPPGLSEMQIGRLMGERAVATVVH